MNEEIKKLVKEMDDAANILMDSYSKQGKSLNEYEDYLVALQDLNDKIIFANKNDMIIADDYKITRATYQLEMNKLFNDIIAYDKNIVHAKEKLKEATEKRLNLINELKAIELSSQSKDNTQLTTITNYDGKKVAIYNDYVKNYQNTKDALGLLDIKISALFLTIEEYMDTKDVSYTASFITEENIENDKQSLEQERDNIINEMTNIENISGKKALFNVSVNGQTYKKQIAVKHLAKYKNLYKRLITIEKELNKNTKDDYTITFDEELYNNMSEMQKIAYVANLELQIENKQGESLFYVDKLSNKKIPLKYKSLYGKLLRITNKDAKNHNYLTSPLSKEYLSKLPLSKQKEYYKNLIIEIIKAPSSSSLTNYKVKDINIKVANEFIPMLDDAIKCYDSTQKSLEEEAKKVKIEIENIEHLIPKEPITVTVNNKEKTIDKDKVATLSELESSAHNLEEFMSDSVYDEIPLDYSKDLDIKINEEYLETLNKEEQKAYYTLLLHDIVANSKEEYKVLEMFNNNTYRYDERYSGLFHEIVRRYNNILKEEKKSVVITEKRKPKFLDKIKKELKKKGVQIALGAMALISVLASSRKNNFNINENIDVPVATNIEELIPNEQPVPPSPLETEAMNIANDTIKEQESEQDVLGSTFKLNDGSKIYNRYYTTEALNPTFPNDLYTTIGVLLETNYGEEIRVDYNTPDCEEIIYNVLDQGGKIIKRQAVCTSGLQDFLNTGIPTGIVSEESINLVNENSELKDMIISSLNSERTR